MTRVDLHGDCPVYMQVFSMKKRARFQRQRLGLNVLVARNVLPIRQTESGSHFVCVVSDTASEQNRTSAAALGRIVAMVFWCHTGCLSSYGLPCLY